MTFYVGIQYLDADDFPVGRREKIGWFHSQAEAEKWLESCGLFHKTYLTQDYYEWQQNARFDKHSIAIDNVLDTRVTTPNAYVRAWSK